MNAIAAPVTLGRRLFLIASAIAVYALQFGPSTQVRNAGLAALGTPAYVGFTGIFLPHLLLYSTLTAAAATLAWFAWMRTRAVPAPRLSAPTARQLAWGVGGGIVALAVTLVFVHLAFPPGTLHWIDPAPWKIAGNVFSNFYEEFIYRGFMLVVLRAAVGFWPAAIVSSAMWGVTHDQYPLSLQGLITATGLFFCWLVRRTESLWTPYVSHMVLDVVADSLVG
jgi:membrane protease YdiL (CAAX protease family)